jgi:hypothetical protein
MQPAGRRTIELLLSFDRPVAYKTRHMRTERTALFKNVSYINKIIILSFDANINKQQTFTHTNTDLNMYYFCLQLSFFQVNSNEIYHILLQNRKLQMVVLSMVSKGPTLDEYC